MREVNGKWPYLLPGQERDSTLTQQGTTGKLEKNGATVISEPGRMAYLLTEPKSGTFMGLNPYSDPTFWQMSLPGGVDVKADGRLGMARIIVRPGENKIWIDYDAGPNAGRADLARTMLVFGLKTATGHGPNRQRHRRHFHGLKWTEIRRMPSVCRLFQDRR